MRRNSYTFEGGNFSHTRLLYSNIKHMFANSKSIHPSYDKFMESAEWYEHWLSTWTYRDNPDRIHRAMKKYSKLYGFDSYDSIGYEQDKKHPYLFYKQHNMSDRLCANKYSIKNPTVMYLEDGSFYEIVIPVPLLTIDRTECWTEVKRTCLNVCDVHCISCGEVQETNKRDKYGYLLTDFRVVPLSLDRREVICNGCVDKSGVQFDNINNTEFAIEGEVNSMNLVKAIMKVREHGS